MKNTTLSVNQATALNGAIQEVSQAGEDKKPIFDLPFNFNYSCGRTLTKLNEALKPIQEENSAIFDGWDSENRKFQSKIKAASGAEKDKIIDQHAKAFKIRNDKWKKIAGGSIEVELYSFPTFTDEEREQIKMSGITPVLLSNLEPMGLELN